MSNKPASIQTGIARPEQEAELDQIYRSVMIDRGILGDLAGDDAQQSAARDLVRAQGGFINPPDPADMRDSLHHGAVFIAFSEDRLLGYNRFVTDPEVVMQRLLAEFAPGLDTSNESPRFVDWKGIHVLGERIELKKVCWVDRELAQRLWHAAQMGLNGESEGRLAWALDAAVLPEARHQGVGRILVDAMSANFGVRYALRAFRIFEILSANGLPVQQENTGSNRVFTSEYTRPFAYTDTDIMIDGELTLNVRWHHWLRTTRIGF